MLLRKWNLGHWLVISVLIHACVIVPFACIGLHAAAPVHNTSKLRIDLFGMISDRQVEEKRKAPEPPPEVEKPEPPPPPPPVVRPPVKKHIVKRLPKKVVKPAPSPVKVEKKVEKPEKIEPVANTASAEVYKGHDEVNQKQQTIRYEEQPADRMRDYLARLARRIRGNLQYPKEVRKKGIEGVTRITFVITESGTIKEDSLKVCRSSGFDAFDSNALKSVLASAPFDKPPKEMSVSMDVSFTVEMAQKSGA